MRELAARFVPVADEVWRLHHEKGRDCDLFRVIAEQGHYAGRTVPSDTRQGIYCAAPSGVLLASINNHDPKRVAAMLEKALAKWDELGAEQRRSPDLNDETATDGSDFVLAQPEGSVVLSVTARDLAPSLSGDDWRAQAYNVDFAWLRPHEIEEFVPESTTGAEKEVATKLVRRFAALHFVDTVRGQSPPFEDAQVEVASLRARTVAIDGSRQTIAFDGATRCAEKGKWSVANFKDRKSPSDQERSVELTLAGMAVFDTETRRFTEFHLVGLGTRRGGTQFNERSKELGPSEIGFAVNLAPPGERIAPASFWRYPSPRG